MSDQNVVITGLGLVGAVGDDVATACAAQRAGLSRARAVWEYEVDTGDREAGPVIGHPVHRYGSGFSLVGRWVRLATGALKDLSAYAGLATLSPQEWSRTGLIVSAPRLDDDRFGWSDDNNPAPLMWSLLDPVLEIIALPIRRPTCRIFCSGGAGVVEGVAAALETIRSGRLDRTIVLGVDSYLDPLSLRWLADTHRLKTGAAPAGLSPGEAAACALLESEASARRRKARAESRLLWAGVARQPEQPRGQEADPGRALIQVMREGLTGSGAPLPWCGDLVLDLNGETWKARCWGHAQIHLRDRIDFDRCRVVLPCTSFGETGAAAGAVGLCVAVRSFARGYAGGDRILACASGDHGEVGCTVLGTPSRT